MVRRRIGRRKGSRTKGFFFRQGRGWFTKLEGKFIPLLDEDGARLRDQQTPRQVLDQARARFLTTTRVVPEDDAEVGEVCGKYLEHIRAQLPDEFKPVGLGKTYIDRGQTLYDFCYGLPGEFFCEGDSEKRKAKGSGEEKRLHSGFGEKLCSELTPADIDSWLAAHSWKAGGRRTRVQAIKRALNFGVERKTISKSPIRGYKLPKSTSRITYLTPEQEQAMIRVSSPAFATALKVCIRTGARFGCEFAALQPRHVTDHRDRMEWKFNADESKTKRQRIIRITDGEVMAFVRAGLKNEYVFLNQNGEPWTRKMLSQNFRRAKAKLKDPLDDDACMYSCRHTYAKRVLEGFWTGRPASINSLARLMGNTVKVCIDHYLLFSEADNEMLWGAA